MLWTFDRLKKLDIEATDGKIGHVADLYFDDASWDVRYLVVDPRKWIPGRLVLISPHAAREPSRDDESIPVTLTKEKVKNSPDIDMAKPISRRHQEALHTYYGWPYYWGGIGLTAGSIGAAAPLTPAVEPAMEPPMWQGVERMEDEGDPHLRSAREITGYRIEVGPSDEIGRVDDFVVDPKGWSVRYLVIDTGGWLSGRKALLAPGWIREIRWPDSAIHVDVDRETLRNAPHFDPSHPIDRDYEERLYSHYSRARYWEAGTSTRRL